MCISCWPGWSAIAVRAVGWNSELDSGFTYRRHGAAKYCAYLNAVRRWAYALSNGGQRVRPDQVEHLLFVLDGELD